MVQRRRGGQAGDDQCEHGRDVEEADRETAQQGEEAEHDGGDDEDEAVVAERRQSARPQRAAGTMSGSAP